MSLNAGTYLVWGCLDFQLNGLSASDFRGGLSLTSNTLPPQTGGGGLSPDPLMILPLAVSLLTSVVAQQCGPVFLTLNAPATLYLVGQSTFTLGSLTAFGSLYALEMDLE